VARLFSEAVKVFEARLAQAAHSRPGRLAFETLRAYALSLVRLGTRRERGRLLSETGGKQPLPMPDVACCLAIVRLSTDPDSARDLFARSLELGRSASWR
jgi:hypothetical protein